MTWTVLRSIASVTAVPIVQTSPAFLGRANLTEQDVAAAVKGFSRREFSIKSSVPRISRKVDLFEDSYVDSIAIIELIQFLERAFAIELPEADLFLPEFWVIEGIANIVVRNRSSPS